MAEQTILSMAVSIADLSTIFPAGLTTAAKCDRRQPNQVLGVQPPIEDMPIFAL